jgi:hypothetical protein
MKANLICLGSIFIWNKHGNRIAKTPQFSSFVPNRLQPAHLARNVFSFSSNKPKMSLESASRLYQELNEKKDVSIFNLYILISHFSYSNSTKSHAKKSTKICTKSSIG